MLKICACFYGWLMNDDDTICLHYETIMVEKGNLGRYSYWRKKYRGMKIWSNEKDRNSNATSCDGYCRIWGVKYQQVKLVVVWRKRSILGKRGNPSTSPLIQNNFKLNPWVTKKEHKSFALYITKYVLGFDMEICMSPGWRETSF